MGTCLSSQKGRLTSDYVDAVVNKERGSANKPNGPAASSSKMSLGPSASTLGSARSTSGHRDRMSTSNFGSEELSSETTKALFEKLGCKKTFQDGELLIEEGSASSSAIFIVSGAVSLKKASSDKEIARRGAGDLIGEMSLLLGEAPSISCIASGGAVTALLLEHDELLGMLRSDPAQAGSLFRLLATTLSDRIGEASAKMRQEVVSQNPKAPPKGAGGGAALAQTAAKYRQLFGLADDEALLLRTTCSMRKETNAVKEANVQFGEMLLFDSFLCFDWKVFGFHKQQTIPFGEVLALLRSSETANTLEVQAKGCSYELTIPDNFEGCWHAMEGCRRNTNARKVHDQRPAIEGGGFEEVDDEIASAFAQGSRAQQEGSELKDMELSPADWDLFLAGAKQRRFLQGERVLEEGQPTAALFQILAGELRVELSLKGQPAAVVVGHRTAGDMWLPSRNLLGTF